MSFLNVRRRLLIPLVLLLILVALGWGLDLLFPFPQERLSPPLSTRILDRNGHPLRFFLAADGMWRFPVTLKDVSPELIRAIIASEDRHFYRHPGINPLAMLRALASNFRHGRIVSGASTIPMQVARLAEPRPRTIRSKIIEAFRALQLCAHHPKDRILEWYLNLAPFGGNIVGVDAASWLYFGKSPRTLSLGEVALLSILPRSPARYNPLKNPRTALTIRNRVLDRFAAHETFPRQRLDASKKQPLLAARSPLPLRAPHFTRWVRSRRPKQSRVVSSLDLNQQRVVEERVAARMPGLRREGIGNTAVVVLDIRTREVLAHVGSADFWDDKHQGQVDNTLSRRSPGSTLKPFLYALAFDQGHLTPESRLLDVPTNFSGYRPENYGRTFQGLVSARDALALSLNVPAARLLHSCGAESFARLLRTGLSTLEQPSAHYGLSLALGGCEARLLELTNLYATLASGGRHLPVRTESAGPLPPGQHLLSPEACAMVLDILKDVPRPDLTESWELTVNAPTVAWKTGTSFGHRDAWAIGVSRDTAIGVWVGNPDGSQCKNISGARHAAPVLFDVFRTLASGVTGLPEFPTPALCHIPICAVSGGSPGPACPTITTPAIAGKTRLASCAMHQRIFVDRASGLRLQGDCLRFLPAREHTILVWPPELVAHARAQGAPVPTAPPLHPLCVDVPQESAPLILSPSAATTYCFRPDAPEKFQQLSLLAAPAQGATRHFWYMDGQFIADTSPDTPCFAPLAAGNHRVLVTDDLGRTTETSITVHGDASPQSFAP